MSWYEEPFNRYQPGWLAELKRQRFKSGQRPAYVIFDVLCDERGFINIQEFADGILYWNGDRRLPLNELDSEYIKKRHLLTAMDEAINNGSKLFPDPEISFDEWLEHLDNENRLAIEKYSQNTCKAIEELKQKLKKI